MKNTPSKRDQNEVLINYKITSILHFGVKPDGFCRDFFYRYIKPNGMGFAGTSFHDFRFF